MAQSLLHILDIGPGFYKKRGMSVAQRMIVKCK